MASPEFCVRGGAQVWLRKKTEKNKCIPYHPGQHCILPNICYCIMLVCHSHTIIKLSSLKITDKPGIKKEAQLMLTNLRDAFRGQSMSPNMVPFDMLGMISY